MESLKTSDARQRKYHLTMITGGLARHKVQQRYCDTENPKGQTLR